MKEAGTERKRGMEERRKGERKRSRTEKDVKARRGKAKERDQSK